MLSDLSSCSSWSPQQAAGPFAFPSPGRANTPLQSWGLLWFSLRVSPGQSQTPADSWPGMGEGSASLCVLFGDGTTNSNEITL